MSLPRFLADHDLNENIVMSVLRREPAVTFPRVRDVGMQEAPDDAVLEYAQRELLLVVSHGVNTMPSDAFRRGLVPFLVELSAAEVDDKFPY